MPKTVDVQPIRDLDTLEDFKDALLHRNPRDYIIFLIGINTGLRAGDIRNLQTEQVRGKRTIKIIEEKTGKPRTVHLANIYDAVQDYIENEKPGKWLFPSRKFGAPVPVRQIWRQFNEAAALADVEHIGSHTMRKTFGYWFYKQTKDVVTLMRILNHSNTAQTLRYIGITQEEIDEALSNFSL